MDRKFLKRWAPWVVFVLAAIAYYPRFAKPAGLELYVQAAECLLQQELLAKCALPFTYPPVFAFIMMPFVALPPLAQTIVWYLISLGCALACCELSLIIARRFIPEAWSAREIMWLRTLGFLLSLKFILAVYENQAFDLIVLPFILLGVIALLEKREIGAGASFAMATALKVTPLLFLPYLIVRRRFIAASVFIFVLLAVSFSQDLVLTAHGITHSYFVTWLREVAAPGLFEHSADTKLAFWDGANIYNLSLRGTLARLVDGTSYQPSFLMILRTTQIVFVGLIALLVMAAMRFEAMIPIEASLLVIAMLMLSPMTSRTHYVNLMLPYYVLAASCLKDNKSWRLGATVLTLSFIGCTGIPRDLVPRGFTEFMRDHNDIVFGALVLIVYCAVLICFPKRLRIGKEVHQPGGTIAGPDVKTVAAI
jgi:hypothetical protein